MALLSVVLTAVIVLIGFTLRLYLTDEVDRSLISSGRIIASQTLDKIVNNSEVQVIPSDFYLYIDLAYHAPIETIHAQVDATYGRPMKPAAMLQTEAASTGSPFTMKGTKDGVLWRGIIVPLKSDTSGETAGSVLIALPLFSVMQAVSSLVQMMIALSILIILIGAFLSYIMVQRALRGVRSIERVTHQVAAGNISSRVPPIPPSTEVGALADSINTMLASIEYAFGVQQASEQRMRQFVSDASHELRTPLATVRGYAELYRMGGVPSDQVDHAFERIESEANRMGNLVEDLLKLARLDEGRGLTYTEVDLTSAALNAVDDFHARAPERQATVIALDGSTPKPVMVMADSDKVAQVLANLLANVLTHTPSDAAVEVAVGLNPQAPQEAIVEVRDHGPGVKDSDRSHIFERFYRTDSSRSRNTGGTGLGLSIVAATLAAHGGTARVSPTPGGGLTVSLTFPTAIAKRA
ncbi:MAG: HAMP domain-containing sensor histidine kinase [Actinomycetaceae bacterium]|nr:HAMP domain-containing histidine kinase [Arcanobacterium sp.]MDD7686609.1 HAMP domain-containing sensor histidine kinase [Actinomycetaceae bacterium]MDY5273115.1 HAMP domain-containing sensor histidine kinase [Arcanobacterium sp.]